MPCKLSKERIFEKHTHKKTIDPRNRGRTRRLRLAGIVLRFIFRSPCRSMDGLFESVLGAVAMKPEIAAAFDERAFESGLTYTSHPVSLAAAIANIDVISEDKLVERAAGRGAGVEAHVGRSRRGASIRR